MKKMIKRVFVFVLIFTLFSINIPKVKSAVLILNNTDSYDFSANTRGELTGGDFYYGDSQFSGKFWANNQGQKGLQDLGFIGIGPLTQVNIPSEGYIRFGVQAIVNHTYVSLAQEVGNHIVFRVLEIAADYSTVRIDYHYRDATQHTPMPTLSPSSLPSPTAQPSPTQSPTEDTPFFSGPIIGSILGIISGIVITLILIRYKK